MAMRVGLLIIALVLFGGGIVSAAPRYSDWSTPVNLGAIINSSSDDSGAALSKDELSLYFTSTRPGGFGGEDIWVSQRASTGDLWSPPVNIGGVINSADNDRVPAFSRDGHLMFFGSTRSGGFGLFDQWASWRTNVHDDFDWQTPLNLGSNINTAFSEPAASFLQTDEEDGAVLYFASNKPGGMGNFDIYVSARGTDGSWGPASPVVELNSATQDARPTVRHDGLEIFFQSGRPGTLGGLDLWSATRGTTTDPWSGLVNLGPLVNSASDDFQPTISSDRMTLIFGSARPGGLGLWDLYMTTRTKSRGAP